MVDMILSLLTKFVKRKYLTIDDGSPKPAEDILAIDPMRSSICHSLNVIDIGNRAKLFLSESTLFPIKTSATFRKECFEVFPSVYSLLAS